MSRFKEGIAAPAFTGPLASPDDANVTRTPSVTRSFLPSSKKKVHFTMILTSVTPWLQNQLKTPSKNEFFTHLDGFRKLPGLHWARTVDKNRKNVWFYGFSVYL